MKSEARRPRPEDRAPQSRVRSFAIFYLLSSIFFVFVTGCRRDMFLQPSEKPLERSAFFRDNEMASRPLPAHTVARGQLDEDEAFYRGMIGTNLITQFPMPITREVLLRGQERFNIYCAPCHGRTGEGNGMIPQRGYPSPPSYHTDRLRTVPVGHFFDVITRGYGVMYPYANRVEPADRWAIAAYIRALQLSQDAKISDVPNADRAQLEVTK
jgi:cytochrome c553